MKQSLQLRLGQQLTMTPQLQQAIRLLQLSVLELREEIQEALESNPMLDLEEGGEELPSLPNEIPEWQASATPQGEHADIKSDNEQMPDELPVDTDWDTVYEGSAPPPRDGGGDDEEHLITDYRSQAATLQDHLEWQLNLTPFSEIDREIAEAIIDSVNDDGYLTTSLEEIRLAVGQGSEELQIEEVEAVLHRIQAFDPPGIAARDPRECLLIQLKQLPESTPFRSMAIALVQDHFELLASQERGMIRRRLRIEDDELDEIMLLIRSLSPRPGNMISSEAAPYIIPDVIVSRQRGRWHVELNPEASPRLRINDGYANLVRRADSSEDNNFLRNQLQEARWLLKSLHSRNETLLRVASTIVDFQRPFFDYGDEAMKPMILRDVAEKLEMHESTISRVTTQKYMYTPRGTFEFKYFFSSHVTTSGGGECSATAIRALIKKLVAAENPKKPLSDNKLADILGDQGIQVARRTIAKYRESLSIPPSNERKRLV